MSQAIEGTAQRTVTAVVCTYSPCQAYSDNFLFTFIPTRAVTELFGPKSIMSHFVPED